MEPRAYSLWWWFLKLTRQTQKSSGASTFFCGLWPFLFAADAADADAADADAADADADAA